MRKLLIGLMFALMCFSAASYGATDKFLDGKTLTKAQYIKWKENVHQFVYRTAIICGNYKDAVYIYNQIMAHNYNQVRLAINDNSCVIARDFHPLKIEKIYPNKQIASAWLDYSSKITTGSIDNNKETISYEYKLFHRYVFMGNVHDKSELAKSFIK